jgi:hypothetical protein
MGRLDRYILESGPVRLRSGYHQAHRHGGLTAARRRFRNDHSKRARVNPGATRRDDLLRLFASKADLRLVAETPP